MNLARVLTQQLAQREGMTNRSASAEERLHKRMASAKGSMDKLGEELARMDRVLDNKESEKHNRKGLSAYITFEEEEACLRVLETYPQSTLLYCCQGQRKRFGHAAPGERVWVERAPDPSDVIWENLDVRTSKIRSACTFVITLFVLFLSGLAVFLTEDAARQAQREYTSPDCSSLPPAQFNNKTNVVRDEFYEDFGLQTGRTGLLECFCLDKVDFLKPSALSNEQFDTPEGEKALCVDWAQTYFSVQVLTYGGAVITLFVNVILRFILKGIVQFERHRSKTSELLSRAFKMFVLQFLNTAAIVVFINARIDTGFEPLRRGEFSDFSEQWYVAVGTSIVLTMALNIVLPHLFPVVLWLITKYRKCSDRSCGCDEHRTKCITQRQLNRLYMGPKMFLDERYAQAFNVIFVCLAFSSGMPLLLPIAMLSFIVTYWVDAFLFAYVYRTPPRYSADLAKQFTALLPYALLLKLMVGFWMLSNDNIFPPSDAVQAAAADSDGEGVTGGGTQVAAANEATLSRAVSFLDTTSLDFGRRAAEPNVLPHVLMLAVLLVYMTLVRVLVLNLRRVLLGICPCLRFGMGRFIPGLETKRTVQGKGLLNYFDAIPTDVLKRMESLPVKDSLRMKLQRAVENRWKVQQDRQEQIEQYHSMLRDAAAQASNAENAHAEAQQEATAKLREWLAAAQQAERMAAAEQAEQVQAQRQLARAEERARRLAVFGVRKEKAGWAAHNEALLACVQSRELQWRDAFRTQVLGAPTTEQDPLITTRIVEEFETIEEEITEQPLPEAVAANDAADKAAAKQAEVVAAAAKQDEATAAAAAAVGDADDVLSPTASAGGSDSEDDSNPSHSRQASAVGDVAPPAPPSKTDVQGDAIKVEPPLVPPLVDALLSPEEEQGNPMGAEPSPAAQQGKPPPAPITAAGGAAAANPVMSQPSAPLPPPAEPKNTAVAPPPAPPTGGSSTRRRVSGITRRLVQRMIETEISEVVDPWASTAVQARRVSPADVQQRAHSAAVAHKHAGATTITVQDIARADAERDAAAAKAHADAASQNPVLFLLHNRAFQRSLDKLPGSSAPVRYEVGAIHAPLSNSSSSSPLRGGAAGGFKSPLDDRPSMSLASATDEEVWTVTDTEDVERGLGLNDPQLGVLQTAIGGGLQNYEDDVDIAYAVEEQLQARMGSAYIPPEQGEMPVQWQGDKGVPGGALPHRVDMPLTPGDTPRLETAPSHSSSIYEDPHMAEEAFGVRREPDLRSPHAGPDAVPDWGGTNVPVTPRSAGRHTANAVMREASNSSNTLPPAHPQLVVTRSQIENTDAAARAHAAEQAAARQRAIAEDFYRRMGLNMNLKPPDAVQLELKYMRGLHSYDLHDSNDMLSKFGFDTDVPSRYKRRLNTATHKRRQLDAALTGSLHNLSHGRAVQKSGATYAMGGAAKPSPSKKTSMRGSPMRPKRSYVKANMRKF